MSELQSGEYKLEVVDSTGQWRLTGRMDDGSVSDKSSGGYGRNGAKRCIQLLEAYLIMNEEIDDPRTDH